ncbi:MAG TPA: hypothetical protein VLH15_04555 [Dehalococcoidales bacterium]|nr:hypothetical protein [Dehalococcoidales bacterium]
MSIEVRYTVLSPETGVTKSPGGFPPPMGGPPPGTGDALKFSDTLAKRPETLENKTVYLVDTGFGGSYQFMLQLQKWFAQHMPSVTTIRKRKPGNVFMDDNNELWEEVKARGHGVVLGVAG